jgi:hypothetical protein
LKVLREVTLTSQYQHCEETGRIFNFRRAAGKESGVFQGYYFNDSDVYKWVEAVAFSLATAPDRKLSDVVNKVINDICAAQDDDGYLNSYFTFERKKERWTDLRDKHELYCAGHLIQASIAYHRATGNRDFLGVAIRLADHICDVFGPGKREGTPGHPEIEMALVELYRTTGNRTYLDVAKSFIDNRGKGIVGGSVTLIDHRPFRELKEIVGHAVRSIYLNCGAADVFMETGEASLWDTLERLWRNMTGFRMYVTGGIGSRYEGEAFGADYELPNERAYAETCAAVANVMWNCRMFLISGQARFLDILELSLYNGALAGISIDGVHYFYVNPLADRGNHRRQEWFDCACCPPNIARLLASLPGYFYALSDEGIWVNLYARSVANLSLRSIPVTVEQSTDYPWNGEVDLTVNPRSEVSFDMLLRIPGWCTDAKAKVNDEVVTSSIRPGEFLKIHRDWKSGDRIHLSFAMPVEYLVCDTHVAENADKVALKRGPIIYCVEQVDNPRCEVWDMTLFSDPSELEVKWVPSMLGGVVAIQGEATVLKSDWPEGTLYRPLNKASLRRHHTQFIAIPYYAWANRDPGAMIVWVRTHLACTN